MITNSNEIIRSFKNPQIQYIRELLEKKSTRDADGCFIVEGVRLVEEVLQAGIRPLTVVFSANLSSRGFKILTSIDQRQSKLLEVTPEVMNALSETETSQGILAVVPQPKGGLPEMVDLVLIPDQVRDPGNLGTILRTAAAAGVRVVFIPPGTVDPFSPKVVRAAMGAHFHLTIQQHPWAEIIQICREQFSSPLTLLLAESGTATSIWETDLAKPLALVLGGEAEGASEEARSSIAQVIQIPMPGKTESLNVSVAGGIILFEVLRQRSK